MSDPVDIETLAINVINWFEAIQVNQKHGVRSSGKLR